MTTATKVQTTRKAKPNPVAVWWHGVVESIVASFVGWLISFPAVQEAIVGKIECDSPIGLALQNYTENTIEHELDSFCVQAENVENLEKFIEDTVTEDYVKDMIKDVLNGEFERKAEDACRNLLSDVDGIEDILEDSLDDLINKLIKTNLERNYNTLVAQRLSY